MGHAVVLGAGGVTAWALHFGALDALAEAGLPLRHADLVVGTSAGAAVAASRLGGTTTAQALDGVLRPPPPDERRRYLTDVRAHNRRRSWAPAQPGLVRHLVAGRRGVGAAWAGLAPPGVFPSDSLLRFPGFDAHDAWPATLRIVTTELRSGHRAVLGPDDGIDVATAARASQSVPLLFAPTPIGDRRFVDGAVRSSTHADLALASDAETVVVVAPMCRPGPSAARLLARTAARDELAALRRHGRRVVAVRPPADSAHLFRGYRTDAEAAERLVGLGHRLVGAALARADVG